MKNVFDIKREKALNFILPKNTSIGNVDELLKDTIVVMHLYYAEQVEEHIKYIRNIPSEVELLITVSSEYMMNVLDNRLKQLNIHYEIIVKPNRGRDISALLVAAREKILQFKYVCFLHDKKEKLGCCKADVNEWEHCLWENMLASQVYIENVLYTFKNNKELGLLASPLIVTETLTYGYRNYWEQNYINTLDIVKKFNLNCDIDEKKSPIILGTVFWAKVGAIRKLLEYDWKYEHFDEEPLAGDGTLSHAIERVFPFFAQDVGYETGWVMTDQYAANKIEHDAEISEMMFGLITKTYQTSHIALIRKIDDDINNMITFCNRFSKIYIYGAGNNGKKCFINLQKLNIDVEGFIVSDISGNPQKLYGIKVSALREIKITNEEGIIIATQEAYSREIMNMLKENGILDQNIIRIHAV
jgi:rhamnosyltransferase